MTGPALAMLQIDDVPRGLVALDRLAKEAPVAVLATGTVQPGHYLIAFGGEVEAVERSYGRALDAAGGCVVDRVLLADAEPRIVPAFRDARVRAEAPGDALGVVQSTSCPTLLAAIDAALKGAEVDLVELRIADGLGGKAIATLWGDVHDVEAAVELACAAVRRQIERGALSHDPATTTIIPNADAETRRAAVSGTRFFKEWRG
jgi:microcompartment protein CcmL/EutN